ncbi:hypothetical protein SLS60_005564 [Paraconiothyrium brasiliense]|uniref:Uncharacterized protein n=1 Tax=Paraconiothyrium brasiliense TaxID=300254 RepID=A0ABR3RJA4_9PLEO
MRHMYGCNLSHGSVDEYTVDRDAYRAIPAKIGHFYEQEDKLCLAPEDKSRMTSPSSNGLSSKLDSVAWLYQVIDRVTRKNPVIPETSKQFLERQFADLDSEQLTILQGHVDANPNAKVHDPNVEAVLHAVALVVHRF